MNTESIGKLAKALAKAQAAIKGAKKDAENPFFKSNYADLASVWDACREALSSNGLAVTQVTEIVDGTIVLRTILMHSSGESISGILPVMVGEKATAQQLGSAITYNRRYGLAAIAGVAPEDDDGNAVKDMPAKAQYRAKVQEPVKVEAPVNPETGEVSPHQIAIAPTADGEGTDWAQWAPKMKAAIVASKSIEELDDWLMENAAGLEQVGHDSGNMDRLLKSVIAQMRTRLGPSKEAA